MCVVEQAIGSRMMGTEWIWTDSKSERLTWKKYIEVFVYRERNANQIAKKIDDETVNR